MKVISSDRQTDLGPLAWCIGEIKQSLSAALVALNKHVDQAGSDKSALNTARTVVHQAIGAMQVVSVPGALEMLRETELQLDQALADKLIMDSARLSLYESVFRAVNEYLGDLLDGQPPQSLLLFPQYKILLESRGADRVHPADLYFPDTSILLESDEPHERPTAEQVGFARATFERSLLSYLRDPTLVTALNDMSGSIDLIERSEAAKNDTTFWLVLSALFRGLRIGAIESDMYTKRVLTKVNLQVRKALADKIKAPERLMAEVLFLLARVESTDSVLIAVQKAYSLKGSVPTDLEIFTYGTVAPHLLVKAQECLRTTRSKWDQVAAGNREEIAQFAKAVADLDGTVGDISTATKLVPIIAQLKQAAQMASTRTLQDGQAIEVATTILFLEQALKSGSQIKLQSKQHAGQMFERLSTVLQGNVPDEKLPEWLATLARQSEEKTTVGQLVDEIQGNLSSVESGLDGYFRDSLQTHELPALTKLMGQVTGALALLGHQEASKGARSIQRKVQQIIDGKADTTVTSSVASSMSSLGFFVDALKRSEKPDLFRFDEKSETFVVDQAPVLSPKSSASAVKLPMPTNVPTVFTPAASAPVVSQPPVAAESAALTQSQTIDQELAAISFLTAVETKPESIAAPLIEAAAESPVPTTEPVFKTEPEYDPEIMEIFLGEAQEVLEEITTESGRWQDGPQVEEIITPIRRAFHTLKGSSRMVGLNDFGNGAYSIEQTLNLWIGEKRPVTQDLRGLIEYAHGLFTAWVAQLAVDPATPVASGNLIQIAERIRAGEPFTLFETAVAPEVALEIDSSIPELPMALAVDELELSEPPAEVLSEIEAIHASFAPTEPMPSRDTFEHDNFADLALPMQAIEIESFVSEPEASAPAELIDSDAQFAAFLAEEPSVFSNPQVSVTPVSEALFITQNGATADEPKNQLRTIFLSESDDLLAAILSQVGRWEVDPSERASDAVKRAMHSLAGSSAVMQLDDVHAIASSLESYIGMQMTQKRDLDQHDLQDLSYISDRLAAALHRFAAGQPAVSEAQAVERATALVNRWHVKADLAYASFTDMSTGQLLAAVAQQTAASVAIPAFSDATPESLGTNPAAMGSDELDPDLTPIFITEASDLLPQVGDKLRQWSDDRGSQAVSAVLMRHLHTIKGSARMAGAMRFGQLVHDMETRVEAAMALTEIPITLIDDLTAQYDIALNMFEVLRDPALASSQAHIPVVALPEQMLFEAELDAAEQASAQAVAASEAAALALGAVIPALAIGATAQANFGQSVATQVAKPMVAQRASAIVDNVQGQSIRVRADILDRLVNGAGEVSITRSRVENQVGSMRTSLADLTDNVNRLRSQLREIEIQAESQISSHVVNAKPDAQFDPLEFDRFTRFQELTRMLAESVNDVATVQQNLLRNLNEATLDISRQSQLTRDLQQDLMRVRMVQFSSISERLYRVVRLAAKESDKRVNLDLRGGNAEIDRSVLEKMVAPLEHLLRNCVGHGIEPREVRLQSGKSETGEITVDVRQEGNEIVITVNDDGAGLNYEKIRARAVSNGLLDQNAEASDADLANIIFMPGFSTAAEVTTLAGRGVGMDVVRSETMALGGLVEISSERHKGSRFSLRLPLTMAVNQVVIMRAGEYRFSVPAVLVEQVLQLKPQQLALAYSSGTLDWQQKKVPFQYMGNLLDLQDTTPLAQRYSPVVVVRSSNQMLAIHVDAVVGNQEVVVKNIGPQLARLNGITGATILGDGEIVLIMNPVQLSQATQVRSLANQRAMMSHQSVSAEQIEAALATTPTILVVDDSLTVRKVTQRLLTREGYNVVLAKDGVDGLRQIQDQMPDVILTDVEMPRMDGFDFTRAVRSDSRTQNTPIIMITSRTADKHRNHAMALGVNVFLGKPYGDNELLGHIEGFIAAIRSNRSQKVSESQLNS
jgi:chemosensory pili system protein ChpA (sensor histidine kinase/response regulator)